jgi:hypothetical protein
MFLKAPRWSIIFWQLKAEFALNMLTMQAYRVDIVTLYFFLSEGETK